MATWKKIIVSGSNAELAQVTASVGVLVGSNQVIGTTQVATKLTGSFTGSFTGGFTGDGTGLTGVTATPSFPTTAVTNLASTDKFFVNDDPGDATSGNKKITYSNLLTDLAGTNLAVESSDSLTLATTITGLTSVTSTSFTGSIQGTATTASYVLNAVSASRATTAATASVATSASYAAIPQFPTFNVGGANSLTTFFINTDLNQDNNFNRNITWPDLLTDIAGTNLSTDGDSVNLATTITGLTSVSSTSFTGSLQGSASYALTASYAANVPTTASYALQAMSSSFATNASTASYVLNSVSSSYAGNANLINTTTTTGNNSYYVPFVASSTGTTGETLRVHNSLSINPSTDVVTFAGDIAVNGGDITTTSATFNVGTTATTINLGTVNAGTVNIGNASSTTTIGKDLIVSGDMTVNGTITNLNVNNVNIEDQMILLASGSLTGLDAGIIASSGSLGVGSALYHDIDVSRWAVAKGISATATTVAPLEYVTTVKLTSGVPASQEYGQGEMYINTDNGDVWIYS